MAVDTEALRQMAADLRVKAADVRELGNGHMNETLGMAWTSDAASAFTRRTVIDHAAVLGAADRIDAAADALVAHADATDVAEAERVAAEALGDGPGRQAI